MSDQEEETFEGGEEEEVGDEGGAEEEDAQAEEEENPEEGDEEEKEEKEEGEEEEEEKIPEILLSMEMIRDCISLLCKIGDGLAHAYVKLDVKDREITDIKILTQFIHLRYIELTRNNLKDISSLNCLTHLLTLKADQNMLTSAKLDELPYLQSASFNHNRITSTEGVNHPLLEQLSISFNDIHEVSGLDPVLLSRLHTLELRGNKLESTAGITLPNLRNLFLGQNTIKKIEGLHGLEHLTTLHLRDNQLENLDGFTDELKNLQYINLRGNNLTDMKETKKLQPLPKLRALVLADNPIADEDDYRMETLIALRKLERLDKDEYNDDERQEAEEIYEQRRAEELAAEAQEEIASDTEEIVE